MLESLLTLVDELESVSQQILLKTKMNCLEKPVRSCLQTWMKSFLVKRSFLKKHCLQTKHYCLAVYLLTDAWVQEVEGFWKRLVFGLQDVRLEELSIELEVELSMVLEVELSMAHLAEKL